MATKQVIEIDVTWTSYRKLSISGLIDYLATVDDLEIKRITVREKKR